MGRRGSYSGNRMVMTSNRVKGAAMSDKRCRHMMHTLILALILTMAVTMLIHAQSGGGYDLTWSTIDGGGGTSMGAGYALTGAIGQPDAGAMSGGGYTLAGGFWGSGISRPYRVYLPVVIKGS